MKSGAKKKIYVPTFVDWYTENSSERRADQLEPYSIEEGKRIYKDLVKQGFDFPIWN
tara:strand:- start:187 stop:357 length:171 start_codon:yes stop_codon:yes gene_type:complete